MPADPDYQQPAAIPGNAATHTGGDVWLLGGGSGSEQVHGYLDNTDIFRLIAAQLKAGSKSAPAVNLEGNSQKDW
jgi:alkaline phosphatase